MKKEVTSLRPTNFACLGPYIAWALLVGAAGAGCVNTQLEELVNRASTRLSGSSSSSTSTNSGITYTISSVTIGASASGGGSTSQLATLLIDPSKSTGPVSDSCAVATQGSTGTKACSCKFTWTEQNDTTGSSVPIPRTVQTTVTNVQSYLIACTAPSPYTNNEIADGVSISVTIVASGSNDPTAFFVKPKAFTKQTAGLSGAFTDQKGNVFDNIMRYTCYEQQQKGMAVRNKKDTSMTDPNTGNVANVLLASRFCVSKTSGGGSAGQGCEDLPPPDYSAEAYYYNFYIPASRKGAINEENQRFHCPRVQETLATVLSSPFFYPLDQSFALSVARNQDFTIGVEGFATIGVGQDNTSLAGSCGGGNSQSGSSSSAASSSSAGSSSSGGGGAAGQGTTTDIVKKCLGFAAKPNSDGTCPYFRDANGLIRLAFRLRRFVALYPPSFDVDGKMLAGPQPIDYIYVLDRPVNSSTSDPLKPYTMRGPKPCPFSYFDHKAVINFSTGQLDVEYPTGIPQYYATNFMGWTGKNVDGTELPNKDILGTSCSSAIPIYSAASNLWSIGTLNNDNPALRRLFIRPIQAWAPHYEEDTDFQACAPLAQPFVDPPLHFAKDATTGNVSWCAEVYPSQNPYLKGIDQRVGCVATASFAGKVVPFTSHPVKNSVSPICNYTPININGDPGLRNGMYPPDPSTSANTYPIDPFDPYTPQKGMAWHPDLFAVDEFIFNGPGTTCTYGGQSNLCSGSTCEAGTPNSCFINSRKTCDRTVLLPNIASAGPPWSKFPLLARPSSVESAISLDTTFGCILTYDDGGGKTGKNSPAQGCCGANVRVYTGLPTGGSSSSIPIEKKNMAAHLEPGKTSLCLTPQY